MFYRFAQGLAFMILHFIFRIKVYGSQERRTHQGNPLIICSNHRSWYDPMLVAITYKGRIHYMAKKQLFKNPIFAKIWSWLGVFPVDREGNSLAALKTSLKLLKDNKVLGIFPEGTRVKEYREEQVKGGTGMLVIRSKATVLPVYIESTFKLFHPIHIYYGKPFDFEDADEAYKKNYHQVSLDIMQTIYSLKKVHQEGLNGNH